MYSPDPAIPPVTVSTPFTRPTDPPVSNSKSAGAFQLIKQVDTEATSSGIGDPNGEEVKQGQNQDSTPPHVNNIFFTAEKCLL